MAFDFAFLREHKGSRLLTVLVMADKASGCVAAVPLPGKGMSSPWLPAHVVRTLQYYGHHGGIILKSDREHAVTELLHQVARLRGA